MKLYPHLFAPLVLLFASLAHAGSDPCAKDATPMLDRLFSELGQDCPSYISLFSQDAEYFHQHDGFKKSSELLKNCQNYAAFCPGESCRFLQNGEPLKVARGDTCLMLVPYVWSEMPANRLAPGNLEPHTGWEYIIATPQPKSALPYRIRYFAELETSYSIAFNWAKPEETPAVVAESALHLLSLKNSASRGECDRPLAPSLTRFFRERSSGGDVWRQQGDAVVLAAGGICHATVPYAAQVGTRLKTGQFVFKFQPNSDAGYRMIDAVEFPRR